MIVAVDGPAGVGKSTVSRQVAETIGILYLNSGNLYRAITLATLERGNDPRDELELLQAAKNSVLSLRDGRICLGGRDVEDLLHSDSVDSWVAQHSAVVPVRRIVNAKLRELTSGLDAIVEGRDIGTEVFPDAELKVFLDATVRVRAERRFRQGTSTKTLQQLRKNIEMRDKIDRGKDVGSLRLAEGAFYLDTSDLTIDEVCATVIRKIHEAVAARKSGS